MFENLDQINWQSLGSHVYMGSEKIPVDIRNLLSQDPRIRDEARQFLLGGGQEYGSIADTTPHILPYLFEILAGPQGPWKIELLAELSDTLARSLYPGDFSAHRIRLYSQTYQAFRDGRDVLLALLKDQSKDLRLAAIRVLCYMVGDGAALIPEFIRRFQDEPDEDLQCALLQGLKVLLSSPDWSWYPPTGKYAALKEQYAAHFREIVGSARAARIRLAAAHAWLELLSPIYSLNSDLPPQMTDLLIEEFLQQSAPLDYKKSASDFLGAQHLIRDLARLGPAPLLGLLHQPAISPEQAHLVARGLLAETLSSFADPHWGQFLHSAKNSVGLFYGTRLQPRRDKFPPATRYLQAILENDRFWEIPTNLFSFFYGLPDTRDGLRAVLEPAPTSGTAPRR